MKKVLGFIVLGLLLCFYLYVVVYFSMSAPPSQKDKFLTIGLSPVFLLIFGVFLRLARSPRR